MRLALICFSLTGNATMERLGRALEQYSAGPPSAKPFVSSIRLYRKSRYLEGSIAESSRAWAGERFADSDAIVFIGAAGIAVRSIAPYAASKKSDPAVLVIDEAGKYVISLLSGHLGGANELAALCAGLLHAVPVITTATDIEQRFAVDVFAKQNHCAILHMAAAKEVSAALLAGRLVGFYSEFPWEGSLPEGVVLCRRDGTSETTGEIPECGFAVTIHKSCCPFPETTCVVPASVTLGIGCRRGMDAAPIRHAIDRLMQEQELYPEAVRQICSIDLKKDEAGILANASRLQVPFVTYTAQELLSVPGCFTSSGFVQRITGVDNVCERSAVMGSGAGDLIQRKRAGDGVTIAAALEHVRIHFS